MVSASLSGAAPAHGRRGRTALLIAVIVAGLLALATLDKWSYNNDPINDLTSGYNIGGEDSDIQRLYAASVENCHAHAQAAGDVALCVNYQKNLLINLFLNYPIPSLAGHLLKYSYGDGTFLEDVGRAVVRAVVVGLVLASFVALLLLWPLPSTVQVTIASAFALGELVQYLGGTSALELGVTAADNSMATFAALLAGAGLVAVALRALMPAADPPTGSAGWYSRALPSWVPSALIAVVVVLFAGRASGVGREACQIVALCLFVGLFVMAAVQAKVPPLVAVTMAVVMFGLVTDDYGLELQKPRHQGFLVFAAALAYVAVRPRGRLVWLLPLTVLFHVSSAGMTALGIFAAELVMCLRRRRLSHLLGATLATAVPAMIFGLSNSGTALISVGGSDLPGALALLLSSASFWPGLLTILLLLGLALAVLVRRDDSWDAVALFALLLAGVAFASQIAAAIEEAGPANQFTDAYYLIYGAHKYFANALSLGGMLGLLVLLVERTIAPLARPPRIMTGPAWLLPIVAFVCLAIAQAPRLASLSGPKIIRAPAMVALGWLPAKWHALDSAAGDDDDYYMSADNPKNDPILYFSLLKLKVRKAVGRFDPAAMRIFWLEDGKPVSATKP